MVELALLLPILVILLLGAVDFSQVLSVQQRLEHAAHLATLQLLTNPALSVSPYIAAESSLTPVTATASYSLNPAGADTVLITAGYSYPLLMPGLRNMQTRSITDGTLRITVSAAGIATTSAPTVSESAPNLTVTPPANATAPAGLALTCTLYENGVQQAQHACPAGTSWTWTNPSSGGSNAYTATVTQIDGVTSPPSAQVTGP